MNKFIITIIILFSIILSIGCITSIPNEVTVIQEKEENKILISQIVIEPTELDRLKQFLEEDKTNKMIYNHMECYEHSTELNHDMSYMCGLCVELNDGVDN